MTDDRLAMSDACRLGPRTPPQKKRNAARYESNNRMQRCEKKADLCVEWQDWIWIGYKGGG